jgi:hypothetical protein
MGQILGFNDWIESIFAAWKTDGDPPFYSVTPELLQFLNSFP